MIKRKIDDYIRNYYANTRNALLVTGARQTGKTYSIRQFGKTFKSFIEINFRENNLLFYSERVVSISIKTLLS